MAETPEQRRARWRERFDRIYHQVLELHHNREIWDFFNAELPKHNDEGTIHQALARWYVDAQAVAVRRLSDPRDKRSFAGLLRSLRAHASEVTRQQYLGLWPRLVDDDEHGFLRKTANESFDKFAHEGGQHLATDVVDADLETLRVASEKVGRWADENVAHLGRVNSVTVTFGELAGAFDALGELLKKYHNLLTGSSLMNVAPTIQGNWTRAFRDAWR